MGKVEDAQAAIAPLLDQIREHFKAPVLTLLVRTPSLDDGDFVMTEEKDLRDAAAALVRLEEKHRG